jgi:small subunit ribosomal protein S2
VPVADKELIPVETAVAAEETPIEEPKADKKKAADEIPDELGIRDLLKAGLHFGHQTKRWNPKMKPYIFDKRNGIHIIDLAQSLQLLNEALEYIHGVVLSGKSVLFVGTKKQAQKVIKEAAEDSGQHYVTTRWLGGTLTNSSTIRKSVKRMRELQKIQEDGTSQHKKEASKLRRELEKLHRNLGGVANMSQSPGVMVVADINRESIAVKEANKLNIPVVALVDTCCDPDPIDLVVPGNDDSIRAISLIVGAIAKTTKKAHEEYARIAAEIARKEAEVKAAADAKSKAKSEAEAKAKAEVKAKAKAEQAQAKKAKDAKPKAEAKAPADKKEEKPVKKAEASDKPKAEKKPEATKTADKAAKPEKEAAKKPAKKAEASDKPKAEKKPEAAKAKKKVEKPEAEPVKKADKADS